MWRSRSGKVKPVEAGEAGGAAAVAAVDDDEEVVESADEENKVEAAEAGETLINTT